MARLFREQGGGRAQSLGPVEVSMVEVETQQVLGPVSAEFLWNRNLSTYRLLLLNEGRIELLLGLSLTPQRLWLCCRLVPIAEGCMDR